MTERTAYDISIIRISGDILKKNLQTAFSLILIVIALIALIVFELLDIVYTNDVTLNALLNGIIPRLIAGIALLALMIILGCKNVLLPDFKSLHKHLFWCIPCFLVVLANFPFTALIGGSAQILRTDLIALFLLECLSIGFMEEMLFRGLLQDTVTRLLENKPHKEIFTVLITSAIFGLSHLINLFAGANIGATFLQAGYSVLIGAMLSAIIIKTNNIWLCVILHALFNAGGNMVTELGTGTFQDTWFWVFTAVAGIICFAHIIFYLLKKSKTAQ